MWNPKNTTIEIISSYKNSNDSKIGSQAALDYTEKDEISVQTKAPELTGRLTCVLWIYCNGKSSSIFLISVFYSIKNNLFLFNT